MAELIHGMVGVDVSGIGIMLTVLSLNLFGDWLRDH
jgi:ABC-type dipeptide/oligopeptide/nickel transport system permease subunit